MLPRRVESLRFDRLRLQRPGFESLRERLLRAGIAPRHVRRYLSELQDHYDDALRAELEQGADPTTAREAAWTRLGTEDSLAQSMLARPELRSSAARFPALVFGVAPVLAWLGAPFAIVSALTLLPRASRKLAVDAAFIDAFHTLCFLYARAMPVLLGTALLYAAARRYLPLRWPLIGAGTVSVLAGTLSVYSFPGQLGINSSLLPWLVPFTSLFGPREPGALAEGLLRATCLLGLSFLLHRLLQRLGRVPTPKLTAE